MASATSEKPRIDGITRELYQLIGGAPSAALMSSEDAVAGTYKQRLQLKKGVSRWERVPLVNGSRVDGLELKHWVNANESHSEGIPQRDGWLGNGNCDEACFGVGYPFSNLQPSLDLVNYTDVEYQIHLEDPDWSRAETDYLFQLCRAFDLRFLVISDRYNFEGKSRAVEDLKERYYTVTRKILFARNPLADPKQKAEIGMLQYDKAKELERKGYIERLLKRTWQEIQEEETLLAEARRIEQNRRKLERDHGNLMRFLRSDMYGQPSLSQIISGDTSPASAAKDGKGRKGSITSASGAGGRKKKAGSTEPPGTPISDTAATTSAMKKGRKGEDAAGAVPPATPLTAAIKKEKKVSGVFVRSQTIVPIKSQTMLQKVNAVMAELGIAPVPKMPTEAVCKQYDSLLQSIVALLEVKKQTDKLEQELRVLQNRRALLMGEPSALSAGSASVSTPATTPATTTSETPISSTPSTRKRTLPSPALRSADSKRSRK